MTIAHDEARLCLMLERASRNTFDQLIQLGLAALAVERRQTLQADTALIEKALRDLRLGFDEFDEDLEPFRATDPTRAAYLFALVSELACVASIMGAGALFRPNAMKFYQEPFREEKRKAARKGAELRRREADEGWRPHALKLAREIQAENSNASQANLAAEITKRWRLKIPCPSAQFVKAIRQWQAAGELLRRNRH
jgi:hypothetical protein